MVLRNYSNIASPVALSDAVDGLVTTLTVASTADYPAPPFLLALDRGTANEEVMLCTATTATTFTVVRGYDGTTAVAHSAGATVEHTVAAIDYRQSVGAGTATPMTLLQRDALAADTEQWHGRLIRNTDTGALEFYTGTSWVEPGVPTGGIIMWSGAVTAIPTGWTLCDGLNGTPDLRDRFVVGAGGTYAVGAVGGAAAVTLTAAQIPSHAHSGPSHAHAGPSHTHSGPSHTHASAAHTHASGTLATGSAGSHYHTTGVRAAGTTHSHTDVATEAGGMSSTSTGASTGVAQKSIGNSTGAHTHGVSGSTASTTPVATGASGTGSTGASGTANTGLEGTGNTGATGGGGSHENRPPYYALAYIMKVAA